MKKSILVLAAVTIAISIFAFTTKQNTVTRYSFKFNSALPYTEANVENPANWSLASGSKSCDAVDEKACSMEVDGAYVNTSGSQPVLNSSINIQSDVDATHNTAYVTSTADQDAVITNKSN